MKNSILVRTVCTSLAVCMFAGMAMASGSSGSSNSKETGSVTIAETTEETTTTEEAKVEYEITNTTFLHHTNSIDNEEYVGIIEITNTGSTYIYLKECTFDFEDNDGHLLQTDKMISKSPDVIAPGEKGYFFNDGLIDDGVSLENGINLVPNFSLEIATKGAEAIIEYEVSDLDLRDGDYGGVKVTGRVTNNTTEETNHINATVTAIFFDSEGKILDIGYTYLDPISAGGKVSFELSTMLGNSEMSAEDVANYVVIARHTYDFNW